MGRIINGILFVGSFDPTGNPGEYQFHNALYTNQTDVDGLGTDALEVGFVVYIPASDLAGPNMIPGVVHRYRLTIMSIINYNHISGTIIWDEKGSELDQPTNGVDCIISQTSIKNSFGFPVSEDIYPTLQAGFPMAAINIDTKSITDNLAQRQDKFISNFETEDWVIQNGELYPSIILSHGLSTTSVKINVFQDRGDGYFGMSYVDWFINNTVIKLMIAPNSAFSGKVEIQTL
jgi:hypothetical protein